MPDGPWHAAVPVLAAAAAVTSRVRLGTLVASPNFRHPVPLARDVLALDDVSAGRFDLGIGPGSGGPDATALGEAPWSSTERMDRFEEFLHILRAVLDGDAATRTTITGRYYAADETPSTPGTLQTPFPVTIAAGGRRGLGLAADFGQQWVTIGPTSGSPAHTRNHPAAPHGGSASCWTRPAAKGARRHHVAQGPAVDADRDHPHLERPVRRARRALRGAGIRRIRPAPSRAERALRRIDPGLRADRGAPLRCRPLTASGRQRRSATRAAISAPRSAGSTRR